MFFEPVRDRASPAREPRPDGAGWDAHGTCHLRNREADGIVQDECLTLQTRERREGGDEAQMVGHGLSGDPELRYRRRHHRTAPVATVVQRQVEQSTADPDQGKLAAPKRTAPQRCHARMSASCVNSCAVPRSPVSA